MDLDNWGSLDNGYYIRVTAGLSTIFGQIHGFFVDTWNQLVRCVFLIGQLFHPRALYRLFDCQLVVVLCFSFGLTARDWFQVYYVVPLDRLEPVGCLLHDNLMV